jgi:hypothetical protein
MPGGCRSRSSCGQKEEAEVAIGVT